MKAKNIVFIAKSIDGFIAGQNGELDWLQSVPNPENDDMGFVSLMKEIDAVVMGKTTFETVSGFEGPWPYQKQVFVLSNSLKEVPQELETKVSLLSGSPQEILQQIHQQNYFKLCIDGGRTLQEFLREDLIDELRITTIPVMLGEGIRLFDTLPYSLAFDHVKSEVFLDQIVQSWYVRKR